MSRTLPWTSAREPLMLAPMQGITNRALRRLFIEWVRPDVVFTEFVRVQSGGRRGLAPADREEVSAAAVDVPLVVQLIGADSRALVAAAEAAEHAGARHLNLNLGCPFGRMTGNAAGGVLLGTPGVLPSLLQALRKTVRGTLSVKVRAGYEDPKQIFSLLPLFEGEGIDFLVLHPRTVKQGYSGLADHGLTGEVVQATSLPVIANGDVTSVEEGHDALRRSGAAGLMIGRGAISDPLLFERLRGFAAAAPTREDRARELKRYLLALLDGYRELFCGETQVLYKLKEVLRHVHDAEFAPLMRDLKRSRDVIGFLSHVQGL